MNLLSGLEKFGLSTDGAINIFDDEKKEEQDEGTQQQGAQTEPTEADFLLDKTVRCQMCEKTFRLKQVKSGRVKRLESDKDLRPRCQYIDTIKYSVISCPYCGYTGLSRSIGELTSVQRKLIQENICAKFTGEDVKTEEMDFYPYDYAIERYKLALFNSIAKKGKMSEKAYICLNISWLIRGKIEELESKDTLPQIIENCKKEEAAYYAQAYEGFMKAVSTENFPMCGMEQSTVDYLLAVMSYHYGKLEVASKFIQSILMSQAANRRMKDKALVLKDEIIAAIKAGKTGK